MHDYLSESQRRVVEGLFQIKRIAEKHGIRFWLIAGTTLGAVRHQGIIPWDDDADVGLLYDDWKRIGPILEQELTDGYQYIDCQNTYHFPRLFGKIMYDGQCCVDLFLLAKTTTSNVGHFVQWRIRKFAVKGYKKKIKWHRKNPIVIRPGTKKTFAHRAFRIRRQWLNSKARCSLP